MGYIYQFKDIICNLFKRVVNHPNFYKMDPKNILFSVPTIVSGSVRKNILILSRASVHLIAIIKYLNPNRPHKFFNLSMRFNQFKKIKIIETSKKFQIFQTKFLNQPNQPNYHPPKSPNLLTEFLSYYLNGPKIHLQVPIRQLAISDTKTCVKVSTASNNQSPIKSEAPSFKFAFQDRRQPDPHGDARQALVLRLKASLLPSHKQEPDAQEHGPRSQVSEAQALRLSRRASSEPQQPEKT